MTLSKQRFGARLYRYYDSVGFLNLAPWGHDYFFFLHGQGFEIIAIGNQYWAVANKNIMECILYRNSCKYIIEWTEIALISRAGLQCRNPHVYRLGM